MDKNSKSKCNCWEGYKRVPGTKPCAPGSCEKCDSHSKESNVDVLPREGHTVHGSIEIGRATIPDEHISSAMTPAELNTHLADSEWDKENVRINGLTGFEGMGMTPEEEQTWAESIQSMNTPHSIDLNPDERAMLQGLLESIIGGTTIRPEHGHMQELIPVLKEIVQKLSNPMRTAAVSQDAAQHLLEEQTPDLDPYAQYGLYKAAAGEEVPFEGVREPEYLPQPGEQPSERPAQVSDIGDDIWEVVIPFGNSQLMLHATITGYDERAGVTSVDLGESADLIDSDGALISRFPAETFPQHTEAQVLKALNESPEVRASLETEAEPDLGYADDDSIYDQQAGK